MMLTSENQVTGVQGSAGVGKTHLIRTAAGIAERHGYRVVVLAPYANQVERLEAEGLRASTLATFLVSKDKGVDESTLIVIDEAGLVPTRQMDATLQIAERHGSRVVLSGDVQQLKAIASTGRRTEFSRADLIALEGVSLLRRRPESFNDQERMMGGNF